MIKTNTIILILLSFFFAQCNNEIKNEKSLVCPELIEQGAQYLDGEDGGAILLITKESCLNDCEYRIRGLYEHDCSVHWDGIFILDSNSSFDLSISYEFVPLSHYEFCTIKQNEKLYKFKFKEKYKECK